MSARFWHLLSVAAIVFSTLVVFAGILLVLAGIAVDHGNRRRILQRIRERGSREVQLTEEAGDGRRET